MANIRFEVGIGRSLFGHMMDVIAYVEMEEVDEFAVLRGGTDEYKYHAINTCTNEVVSCTHANGIFEFLKVQYEDYYGTDFTEDKTEFMHRLVDLCEMLETEVTV